jgi:hypothetical protein
MNSELTFGVPRRIGLLWLVAVGTVASCSKFNLDVPDAVSSASPHGDASPGATDAPVGAPGMGGGPGTTISGTGGSSGAGGATGGSGPSDATCQPGFHLCHGTCADSKSPMTCGMSCDDPCPAPMDGVATCDGSQCGAACSGGKKLCLSACIPDTQACTGTCPSGSHNCSGICAEDRSPNYCGTACKACRAPQGGTATCTNGDCVYACDKGKLCGEKCGECCKNEDCAASQQGQVGTCDVSTNQCKYTCPNGTKDCHGKCVPTANCCDDKDCPMNAGRVGKCDSSTGLCNYSCAGDSKPCGSGCIPGASECCEDRDCKPPAGKVGRCDSGTHQCNYSCANGTSSPESCGSSCTRCGAPAEGQPACVNGQCDFTCPNGAKCGNRCVDVQHDILNCGTCGHKCDAPSGGVPACVDGHCDFACPGTTKCNAQCRDTQGDPKNCGTCGNTCGLSNAETACVGGKCMITTCKSGFADCNGKPADGCEVNLTVDDDAHCRSCKKCGSGQICLGGDCIECGNPGFNCCRNFQCPGGGMCCRDSATGQCAFNCSDCGKPGLPCCLPDFSCAGGGTCCRAGGGNGQCALSCQ